MSGYSVTTAVGRVFSGETDEVWAPRDPRTGRCGVVLVHGSGAPTEFVDPVQQPSSLRLAAALASAGVPCIAGDFGGQTWGNDTALSRIDAAWAYLRTLYPSMRSDKVILVGVSMGGAACARYTQNNPSKVAAFLGLIPLTDIVSFYNAATGSVKTEVAGAWGVTSPAALPGSANIAANPAVARSVPTMFGYSSVDNIVLPQWVINYGNAVGASMYVTDSTYGHSDQAVAGLPIPTAGSFLARWGA